MTIEEAERLLKMGLRVTVNDGRYLTITKEEDMVVLPPFPVESSKASEKVCEVLGMLFRAYSRESIDHIEHHGNMALICFENGYQKPVNIGSDSVAAMITDITREIIL